MRRRRGTKYGVFVGNVLCIMALLIGCSSSPEEQPFGTVDGDDPVEIEWLAYNSYAKPKIDNPIGKMVEDRFNAKFNVWYIDPKNWEDSLTVRLGAGEMPDIMKVQIAQNLPKYVNQGILAPIPRELFEKYAPEYTKILDQKKVWDRVTLDGQIYAIPTTNPDGNYPTAVIWREDWLKNVGIEKLPESIEEYEDALTKFRNNDPDRNGKKDTYGMSDFAIPNILGAFGHPGISDFSGTQSGVSLEFMRKNDEIVFAAIQPEMKEALALLQRWYNKGLIDPEFLTSENTTGYWPNSQAFFNGRIGLTGKGAHYHWRTEIDPTNPEDKGGSVYNQFKQSQPNGSVVIGVPAVGPQGKSGVPQWDIASTPLGITTKAAKDPKKVETLLKMVEVNATDFEFHLAMRMGEEGKDYMVDNGRYISLIDDPNNSKESRGINVFHMLIARDDFYKTITGKFNYEYADRVYTYKGYPPVFVPPVEAYPKHLASLHKLTLETYFNIITGDLPIDAFDDYVKRFTEGGGDEIERQIREAAGK